MPTNTTKTAASFTKEELAAMKQRAKELAAEAKSQKTRAQGEADVVAAIAAMSEPDRSMAKRIHEIVKASGPSLMPKTWYGMPAYALAEKVICWYQPAEKFKARYGMLGFGDGAKLDEGNLWATAFAVTKLTPTEEKQIAALVKQAVG